jgi:hypothetical protein
MKNISISKIALVAGLAFNALAFAAHAAAPAAAGSATTAAPAPSSPSTQKAAKSMSFTGMVVSTDAIANSIVVKNTKSEATFSLAPTGKISQGKKEVNLADITKDQKVTVKYTEEAGVKTASAIKVSAAAIKKEAKTSTAAPAAQ